jgi:hypothetical protein
MAVVAAACVAPTTLGTATPAGPLLTVKVTADPEATLAPAAGLSLITSPEATLLLFAIVTVPTVNPAPVIELLAAACAMPTTFGTVTLVVLLPPPPPPPQAAISTRAPDMAAIRVQDLTVFMFFIPQRLVLVVAIWLPERDSRACSESKMQMHPKRFQQAVSQLEVTGPGLFVLGELSGLQCSITRRCSRELRAFHKSGENLSTKRRGYVNN